jgi:hypothetical protein
LGLACAPGSLDDAHALLLKLLQLRPEAGLFSLQ